LGIADLDHAGERCGPDRQLGTDGEERKERPMSFEYDDWFAEEETYWDEALHEFDHEDDYEYGPITLEDAP
jgi:hypothetical protein